jgi:hypothetical protein
MGYLESTAASPAIWATWNRNRDKRTFHLKYQDGDIIQCSSGTYQVQPFEVFNRKESPSLYTQFVALPKFTTTEGGQIPGTIEAAAPYTPLNVSEFNKNLNSTHNNLQAFANAVDEMTCGPGMYAGSAKDPLVDADEFAVIDSETSTHLVRKFTWANLKARIFAAFGLSVNGAGAKATPVDGDLIPLVDSETAGKLVRKFTWADLKAELYPFIGARLFLNTTLTTPVQNALTLLHLNGETFDVGSIASVSTHEITIPVDGYYFVSAAVGFDAMTADSMGAVSVWVDSTRLLEVYAANGGSTYITATGSDIFHFTAGQKLSLYYASSGATTTDVMGDAYGKLTWLSVILFKAD